MNRPFANPLCHVHPVRPAAPRCRSGASSLLRLADPASCRLPSGASLAQWVQRAAQALEAPAPRVAAAPDAPLHLITRLWPSPAAANALQVSLVARA